MLPYATYLRVYQPLAAFPEPERSRYAAAASERISRRSVGLDVEHEQALRRLIAVPPIVAPAQESPQVYVQRVDGALYVCPWQVRLRSWVAFARFRDSVPAKVIDAYVPRQVHDQVLADFADWKQRHSGAYPHILTSTWHVPLVWFVAFDPGERWLVLGDGLKREGAGATTAAPTRTLIYVTAMAKARRRLARALAVVRRTLGEGLIESEIEELGRWLEEFHPHALVELDYGGLVHVLDDAALRGDQSVAEVASALAGLEAGDDTVALTAYRRLIARWRAVQALESAN